MATVQGTTGGKGTRAIATRYPYEEGTTFATTKTKDKKINLKATEGTLVARRKRVGL